MYETSHFTVVEYIDVLGRSPYRDWLTDLHVSVRARIQARIFRIESGNLGKCRVLTGGIHELKFDFGPGYRVYFALSGKRLIVLLVGGDKKTQSRDIRQAKEYWSAWQEGERDGQKKP